MTTIDTLLFGEANLLKPDGLCRVNKYITCLGGKGMVTALSAFVLGCEVAAFTLVGEHKSAQEEVIRFLPLSFSTDYLKPWLLYNNKTWIMVSSSQGVYTFVHPSPTIKISREELKSSVHKFINSVDVLYISTEHTPIIREVIRASSRISIPIVSNINLPLLKDQTDHKGTLIRSLVNISHTILLNEDESLQTLKKLGLPSWEDTDSRKLEQVIVTKGEKGGSFSTNPFHFWDEYNAYVPPEIKCVVGAGDTFNGAYLKARFVDGLPPKSSCSYASQIAGRKVSVEMSTLMYS